MQPPDLTLNRALGVALGRGEVGVQVAVWGPSGPLIEAHAGSADRTGRLMVDADTLFPVYSLTEALTAIALQIQMDRGLITEDRRVSELWPEFGCMGKRGIRVGDVIAHRPGLSEMPVGATDRRFADWDWMTEALSVMAPTLPPGVDGAYSRTWGWLVAELVRRSDPARRAYRQFVAEEILGPLGITDCWLGVPLDHDARVAPAIPTGRPNRRSDECFPGYDAGSPGASRQ